VPWTICYIFLIYFIPWTTSIGNQNQTIIQKQYGIHGKKVNFIIYNLVNFIAKLK
jgi:hypothetical protein